MKIPFNDKSIIRKLKQSDCASKKKYGIMNQKENLSKEAARFVF